MWPSLLNTQSKEYERRVSRITKHPLNFEEFDSRTRNVDNRMVYVDSPLYCYTKVSLKVFRFSSFFSYYKLKLFQITHPRKKGFYRTASSGTTSGRPQYRFPQIDLVSSILCHIRLWVPKPSTNFFGFKGPQRSRKVSGSNWTAQISNLLHQRAHCQVCTTCIGVVQVEDGDLDANLGHSLVASLAAW